MQILQGEVKHLNLVLGNLAEKLVPVLRGKRSGSGSVGGEVKEVEEKVGLARVIEVEARNVQEMALEMEHLVARLEL